MYKYALLLLATWSSLDARNIRKLHDYEAYYWKDFNGVVPPDAFSAGKYKNNENIYIVQVLHTVLLIPGRLDENLNQAVYEYNTRKWSTTENIKIFCTEFPHLMEWISVNSSASFIVGGYEPQNLVFIGRGDKDGDLLVGKVIFKKGTTALLHTIQNDESVRLKNFEVLSFTPLYLDCESVESCMSVINVTSRADDGHYYRDFKGTVPYDAFVANVGYDNEPIYIVQVLYIGLLIPGVLDKDNKRAVFEYGTKQRYSENNFKILCTKDIHKFQWRKNDNCSFFTSNDNINGGYEQNRSVFIGRGVRNNQLLVGKVIVDGKNTPLLHTTQDGESVRLETYEILAYSLPDDNTSVPCTNTIFNSDAIVSTESSIVDESVEDDSEISTTVQTTNNLIGEKYSDLKHIIDQYLEKALKSYGLIIEPTVRKNDKGFKSGQRIYIININ